MLTSNMNPVRSNNDTELVRATLAGDREAYGRIVARYQALVSSLAYSATGSLSQSEDLAQETFVAAWKSLAHLPEPENLRAWLCGIARNLINNALRKQGREPSHAAASIEDVSETHSPEPLPVDHAISNEEQAILWRALERIPETYREPLVLFYREHQSVEAVAEKMALSTDTVHQRLSRGRKFLAEEVTAFVEGALEKTSPGKSFTVAVVAALPLAAASAKAATVGVALAQGGAAAKGALAAGTLGGFFVMVGGILVTLKAQIDDSKSPREREFMLRHIGRRWCLTVPLVAGLIALFSCGFRPSPLSLGWLLAGFGLAVSISSAFSIPRFIARRWQIQIEDGTFNPAEWTAPRKLTDAAAGAGGDRWKQWKFLAGGVGMSAFVIMDQPWKTHPERAATWGVLLLLCLVRGFVRWGNAPRFNDLRGPVIFFPVFFWLMTVGFFDLHWLGAGITSVWGLVSNTDAIMFNLVVSAAYVTLIAILAVRHRKAR